MNERIIEMIAADAGALHRKLTNRGISEHCASQWVAGAMPAITAHAISQIFAADIPAINAPAEFMAELDTLPPPGTGRHRKRPVREHIAPEERNNT